MFRKTHIRLTLLNSLVLFVLISTLGSIIYLYTENRLYQDVNKSLLDSVEHFQQRVVFGEPNWDVPPFIRRDPRIMTLIWIKDELVTEQSREADLFVDKEDSIRPQKLNALEDVKIEGFTYRYIAFNMETEFGITTVQFIRNVNSEKELLDRLLIVILVSCGIGMIAAVASGYFLAGRALIPIRNAWQKQQQFVSDASHELRTPLSVIQVKTDLLLRNPQSTIKERVLDISTISNESRRLSKLVANLLTLARTDSDQIEIKKEDFRLDEMLHDIIRQYEDIALYEEKSLELKVPEQITFFADQERIHQLIIILLDNALKYTNKGGEIVVSCHEINSSINLQVSDTGIGISEEDIPRIFDRFFQSDKVRTSGGGAGLGLSIAKWIIDKHQGKAKVHSSPGKGTTIELSFPKVQKGTF